eukprot:6481534-Amphidinium_carterae.2
MGVGVSSTMQTNEFEFRSSAPAVEACSKAITKLSAWSLERCGNARTVDSMECLFNSLIVIVDIEFALWVIEGMMGSLMRSGGSGAAPEPTSSQCFLT